MSNNVCVLKVLSLERRDGEALGAQVLKRKYGLRLVAKQGFVKACLQVECGGERFWSWINFGMA